MKTIMAGATRTANIGDIISVDNNFADELIKSGSAELIEEISEDILKELEELPEQEVEVEQEPEQEVEIKQEPQKKSKKRKR